MRRQKLSLILLVAIILLPTLSWSWSGKVVGVSDGDTITVMHDGKGEKIRLYGVDCPEKHQDFGEKAKQFTSNMVFGRTVEVHPIDTDRYGRTVGVVSFNGKLLNEELVRAGMAWVYSQYCKEPSCSQWQRLQEGAKRDRTGLWSMSNLIPPWEFRRDGRTAKSTAQAQPLSMRESQAGVVYHGNLRSKVFHAPGCKDYDCKNCTAVLKSKEEALKAGFRPHVNCVKQ